MNEKTIPILTMPYWWVVEDTNYGSLLQCYALQRVLRNMGWEPLWIKHAVEGKRGCMRNVFAKIYRCMRWPNRILGRKRRKEIIERWRKLHPRYFEEFIEKHIAVSECCCYSEEELRQQYGDAPLCIVGSDQMWNSDEPYLFLSFMQKGKRLAYAVGAPWLSLSASWKRVAERELKSFAGISVRESQGIEVLRNMGIDSVRQAVDPCLLLPREAWYEISEERSSENPYAFGYFINGFHEEDIELKSIAEYCNRKQWGLKIVPNQGSEAFIPEQYMQAASPQEFLNLIRNSQVVFTNSFHAVVFSIIFHKQFVIIPQLRERRSQNVRFDSICSLLGISPRMISSGNILDNMVQVHIDYEQVESRLEKERAISMNFLSGKLQEVYSE